MDAVTVGFAFSTISLVFATGSLVVAVLNYLERRKQSWGQALFRIADRLENDEMRRIRHTIIYQYRQENAEQSATAEPSQPSNQSGIDRWGAEMDLLALLFLSKLVDPSLFFHMYGDVVLRSAYALAPYVNKQRSIRGNQFWLPFQQLTAKLLKVWKKKTKKHWLWIIPRNTPYPETIGLPSSQHSITPSTFKADAEVTRFLNPH